ncbi:MAG TPA: hypothetical protein P5532_24005 [Planctomycetota bacterium]|nr:hypothetical protein [Planctomycetota bacterium]HRT97490.1 hypothetical protein [Planctomycetota bacterium]
MADDKQARLKELREKLEDLKKRNPAHCSGTATFVSTAHSMPPTLYAQIEELEDQIKALEAE